MAIPDELKRRIEEDLAGGRSPEDVVTAIAGGSSFPEINRKVMEDVSSGRDPRDLLKSMGVDIPGKMSEVPFGVVETAASLAGQAARFAPPIFIPYGISKGVEAITGKEIFGLPAYGAEKLTTYEPQTEVARNVMGAVAAPFEALHKFGETAADVTREKIQKLTGSETAGAVAGTTIGTGIQALPYMLAGKHFAKKAGETGTPLSVLPEKAAGKLESWSEKLFGSALKTPVTEKWVRTLPGQELSKRQKVIQTGIKERVPVTEFGAEKARGLEQWAKSTVDDIVRQGTEQGEFVWKDDIVSGALDRAYRTAATSSDPVGAMAFVDRMAKDFSERPEKIPLNDLLAIKRQLYTETTWTGTPKTGLEAQLREEGIKGLSNKAKQLLEYKHPELRVLNEKDSAYIGLVEALEKRLGKISNQDLVPVKSVILLRPKMWPLAFIELLVEQPWMKSRLSFALDRAAKKLRAMTPEQAAEVTKPIAPPWPKLIGYKPEPSEFPYFEENLPAVFQPRPTGPPVPTGEGFGVEHIPRKRLEWRRTHPPQRPLELPPGMGFEMREKPAFVGPEQYGPGITKAGVPPRKTGRFIGANEYRRELELARKAIEQPAADIDFIRTMFRRRTNGQELPNNITKPRYDVTDIKRDVQDYVTSQMKRKK